MYMLSQVASVEITIYLDSHKKTGICQIKNVKNFNYHLMDTKWYNYGIFLSWPALGLAS